MEMLIELHKFRTEKSLYAYSCENDRHFFPRSRGRNLEGKERPDSFWKPKRDKDRMDPFL